MTAALEVGYPVDADGEVGRSCAVETAVRQNTKTQFWDAQTSPKSARTPHSDKKPQPSPRNPRDVKLPAVACTVCQIFAFEL